MKKTRNFLLTACLFLGLFALGGLPFLTSLAEQAESLAQYLVPDEIERFISALSEKLA